MKYVLCTKHVSDFFSSMGKVEGHEGDRAAVAKVEVGMSYSMQGRTIKEKEEEEEEEGERKLNGNFFGLAQRLTGRHTDRQKHYIAEFERRRRSWVFVLEQTACSSGPRTKSTTKIRGASD